MDEHRLLCGDSTSEADMKKLMDGELADMVFTDPPYNVNYGDTAKDKLRSKGGAKPIAKIMNDNLGEELGCSPRNVQRFIAELEDHKLLTTHHRPCFQRR